MRTACLCLVATLGLSAGLYADDAGKDKVTLRTREVVTGTVLKEDWKTVELDKDGDGKADATYPTEDVDAVDYANRPRYMVEAKALKKNSPEYILKLTEAYDDEKTPAFIRQHACHDVALAYMDTAETIEGMIPKVLDAWDTLFIKVPDTRYAVSGRLELAGFLIRHDKRDEAVEALKPLVDGQFGPKAQASAKSLMPYGSGGTPPVDVKSPTDVKGPDTHARPDVVVPQPPASVPADAKALAAFLDKSTQEHAAARQGLLKWCVATDLYDQAIEQMLFAYTLDPSPAWRTSWEDISAKIPATVVTVKVNLQDGTSVRGACSLKPLLVVTKERPVVVPCDEAASIERIESETAPRFRVTTKKGDVLEGVLPKMKLALRTAMGDVAFAVEDVKGIVVERVGAAETPATTAKGDSFLLALDLVSRTADSDYAAWAVCRCCTDFTPKSASLKLAEKGMEIARADINARHDKYPPMKAIEPTPVDRIVTTAGEVIEGRILAASDAALSVSVLTPDGWSPGRPVPKDQIAQTGKSTIPAERINDCAKKSLAAGYFAAVQSSQNVALLAAWGRMNVEFPDEKWDQVLEDAAAKQRPAVDQPMNALRLAYKWAGEACPECFGAGHAACKTCSGKGKVVVTEPCPVCHGIKPEPVMCEKCGGHGKLICGSCGGQGAKGGGLPGARELCGRCNGRGWVICDKCNGKGKITSGCATCQNKGTVTKTVACADCGGSGAVNCASCGGDGKRKDVQLADTPMLRKLLPPAAGPVAGPPPVKGHFTRPDNPAVVTYSIKATELNKSLYATSTALALGCARAGMLDDAMRQLKVAALIKPGAEELTAVWSAIADRMPGKSVTLSVTLDDGTQIKGKCTLHPLVFVHKDGVALLNLWQINSMSAIEPPKLKVTTETAAYEGEFRTRPLVITTPMGEVKVPIEKIQGFNFEDTK